MRAVKKVQIEANVVWRSFKSPTSSRYVAVCDELNLCLEGESEDELKSLIPEAMHLLMIDLLEDNEIDAYLRAKGWQATNLPQRRSDNVEFDVPFEMIAEEARLNDSTRRAH
jgi:predicted RNase H-like HicB family nuclease